MRKRCEICGMKRRYILHRKKFIKNGYWEAVSCAVEVENSIGGISGSAHTHNMPAHKFRADKRIERSTT